MKEISALRRSARRRVETSGRKKSAVLEWVTLEIALFTGLRVHEIASLSCGDLWLDSRSGSLLVQNGKGGKKRVVKFGECLGKDLREYLAWKRGRGEGVDGAAPLLLSSHTGGHLSTRAIQKMFQRLSREAKVKNHRFHDLRHSYASHLYRASGNNLRLVQKQLGHSSIRTTEIYADILDGEAEKAVNAIYRK